MRLSTRYCGIFLGPIVLLGFLPASAFSAEVSIRSDTIIRAFSRDTATKRDALVLPGYEYLQLDAGQLKDYGVSYHLYGWGRADFADNDYFEDQTDGELLYGYVEYRRKANRFGGKLGRQYVFEGVANEAIDGVRLGGDLGNYFSLSLYGGQPVGLASDEGRSGDSIYGGRLAHRFGSRYELGLSYKSIDSDHENAEEKAGFDLSLFMPANLSLYGNSAYNLETEGWAEQSYELRIPLGSVLIKPLFQHFSYEDYFGVGDKAVNPFRNLSQFNTPGSPALNPILGLAQFDEELTAYGVDALWQLNPKWTLGGKAKFFTYDQRDEAQTASVLVIWQGDGLTRVGGEVGRTMSDDTAANEYTLLRLYGYREKMAERLWLDFISGDVMLVYYDEAIYGEKSSLFVSLGGGKRFLGDTLSIKLSADYSQDPYFDDDLRGMLTMSYFYNLKK
jgi:hypothetical protein